VSGCVILTPYPTDFYEGTLFRSYQDVHSACNRQCEEICVGEPFSRAPAGRKGRRVSPDAIVFLAVFVYSTRNIRCSEYRDKRTFYYFLTCFGDVCSYSALCNDAITLVLCSCVFVDVCSRVALFSVTTIVVLQKVLGRTFVMVQLCHSNNFGSL
jgi:hypothetical protein